MDFHLSGAARTIGNPSYGKLGATGQPFLRVIREKCSQALHILDRFHIVAKMNLALDDVRAEESNRMRREGRVPVLKKSR